MHTRRYKCEKGRSVTLLEVIVGISIVVLISGISFANIKLDDYKVDGFIREFSSDLRYVRKLNQMGNNRVSLVFTKQNARKNGYILYENGVEIKKIYLPQNAEIKYSSDKIIFDRVKISSTDEMTIIIKYKGEYKEITVVPISGRVLIKEGIYE